MRQLTVSCVIPAFNEAENIQLVIKNLKKVNIITEIIVVDDGSKDKTAEIAKAENVIVIKHKNNKGKGAAIKTGLELAKGDIVLFLDADVTNITPKKITSILQPLENDEADLVKASFHRARGRVTELVVKPLFNVVFPFLNFNFNQPLSGQFAIKKEIMKDLTIDDKWGVDIQILLQSLKKGLRVVEVDIGELIHKKQPIENLKIMSEQVIKSILAELGIIANKHKLIIFDFDKTIVEESSIEVIARQFGFLNELETLRHKYSNREIRDYDITLQLAQFLKGKNEEDMKKCCAKMNLAKDIEKVMNRLKTRQYSLGIISVAFSPIVYFFSDILNIPLENIICPILVKDRKGFYTGEVIATTKHNSACCDKIICKADAAKALMKKLTVKPEECIAVADGKSDECLFRVAGLSLAYKPETKIGDVEISHMSEVLIYAE